MSLKDKIKRLTSQSPEAKAKKRNAVQLVISLNGMNMATSLDKIRSKSKSDPKYATVYGNVLGLWTQMGGQPKDLIRSIEVGRAKKPIKLDFLFKSGSSSAEGGAAQGKINFTTILNAMDMLSVYKEMTKGVDEGSEISPPPTPDKPEVTILGMNPWLAGGLFLAILAGGGIIIYKKLT